MGLFKDIISSKSIISSKRFVSVIGIFVSLSVIVVLQVLFGHKSNKGVDIDPLIVSEMFDTAKYSLYTFVVLLGGSGVIDGARSWMESKKDSNGVEKSD
jgi:hypothetical protein